ncbi:MAG: SLC13 family permease [Proteobacteria bacterium]|nr:SLC13 family permease [Pseudomonadota bacterium]MDB4826285.1 SLC13 family permease [Gammaproteobacteria bacterium]MBT4107859.1 SLC13 family permease [Pseudomonadota bacterium]MBT5188273.1 SLC13 family permease [Pseudomonadota bacterium]MBT5624337.1 SLC13 family permease [Pseudomonadota bacterium]
MTETIVLTAEMVAVMGILGLTIFLFAFEVVRVDVAAVCIMVLLGLTSMLPGYDGLIPVEHLFDGFSSNAVISIIAVMIIGAGLDKTGIMSQLAGKILKYGGRTESRIIAIISATVGVISSFMQNIGAAALFLPVVTRIARRGNLPISRLLMPMGFCAILGGTMTMVGSSPLILLNDLIQTSNRTLPSTVDQMQSFSLFSVSPIGLVMLVSGILYFIFLGRYVLPVVKDKPQEMGSTLQYFSEVYGISGQVFEARITADSPLAGTLISEIGSAGRGGWIVAVRTGDELTVAPSGDTPLWEGTDLAIMGPLESVEAFCRDQALELSKEMDVFSEILSPTAAGITEVVVPPDSNVIGQSIKELAVRQRYGATVLAIFRIDQVIDRDLPEFVVQAGDTLVLHARWKNIAPIAENNDFAVVTDFPRDDTRPNKLPHAIIFFVITLGLILFSDMLLSAALMTGAIGMIISGVLRIDEAYQSIGWQSVFLLASLIPLGLAVETTGTAAWIAQQTLVMMGDVPIWVLQTMVAVLATIFTLLMSNVGATVLLVPLAVNIAVGAGGDPAVFALTVALATSNSFLIPTHQVNALIMGPGGYRVTDFIKAGGMMTILFLVIMMVMLNLLF